MNCKIIYDIFKNKGFCDNNMADDKYPDNGSCAWKNDRFEMRENDPECTFDNCPFIKKLNNEGV